jgi:threonine dehydrogenase-like Zn-dependent dehydrogenase
MGNEAIGIAKTIDADVHHLKVGDVVAIPFAYSRRVFNSVVDLDGVPEGYQVMDERKAIKVMMEF